MTREAGRAIAGALTAIMTGVAYATSAEMAEELGAFPGYKKNREAMLRVIRNHRRAAYNERTGYEKRRQPAGAARPRRLPRSERWSRTPSAAWDNALDARRDARLSQCAGHRHRAHRHHRPGDGLRHHRHRARLRAGQVQEARRRRLLEDHQPRRARGAAHARLFRKRRSPRSRLTPSATAIWRRRPPSITRR